MLIYEAKENISFEELEQRCKDLEDEDTMYGGIMDIKEKFQIREV